MGRPEATILKMLDFCRRHGIAPQIETFPMSRVNEAFDHLHAGKARYRVVLENEGTGAADGFGREEHQGRRDIMQRCGGAA